MKSKHLLFLLPAAAIVTVLAQGPLTPPGAPAPVMKTLDQIEPRTPVSSLPLTISQPGSYYLTGNLQFTAGTGNAITITANNVTLDLMGFTLSSSNAVTGDAIRINAGLRHIEVKNGSIAGGTVVAITGTAPTRTWTVTAAGFSIGVNVLSNPVASSHEFSHLRIAGCRTMGLNAGGQAVIGHISSIQNGNVGINAVTDSSISHCVASANGDDGIFATLSAVTNCAASDNKVTGITSGSVANSTAGFNGTVGISAQSIFNCTSRTNGSSGIAASVVANSNSTGNGSIGISASSAANCNASTNVGNGILSGGGNGTVANCVAYDNGATGIFGSSGSVINSVAVLNGNAGINAANAAVSFSKASSNNVNNNGNTNIDADGSTRTGNNPAP